MSSTNYLMTVREAAEHIGRPRAFVRQLCAREIVPFHIIGGRYYIPQKALDKWVSGEAPDPPDKPPDYSHLKIKPLGRYDRKRREWVDE